MIDDNDTERVLEWFEKTGDAFIDEEPITSLSLDDLRAIFGVTDVHPDENTEIPYKEGYDPFMVYCYPVLEKHAILLQPHFNHKIDLEKYDYFVAAYAKDT